MWARGPQAVTAIAPRWAATNVLIARHVLRSGAGESRSVFIAVKYRRPYGQGVAVETSLEGSMRKPRPATYNPAQALQLISNDRSGAPLSCPSCSGKIVRDP